MGTVGIPSVRIGLAGVLLCLSLAGAGPARSGEGEPRKQAWVEPEVDRPGSDFQILWLRGGPGECQEACAQNPRCRSYTYVREGVRGRPEGCWLKDDVPPPVDDGCCVSGVKTPDAVSRYLRESAPAPRRPETPETVPPERMSVPALSSGEPDAGKERVPETGSGKRVVAGIAMEAAPPRIPERAGDGIPFAHDMGTGRREISGIRYAAEERPPEPRAVPEPRDPEPTETGTGRKEIRDVVYSALPSSGIQEPADGDQTGAALRKITGVDITAIPQQR